MLSLSALLLETEGMHEIYHAGEIAMKAVYMKVGGW